MLEQAPAALDPDLDEVATTALRLSVWAQSAIEEIRPGRGRPPKLDERVAISELVDLWEGWTGYFPDWCNWRDDGADGGAFGSFVQAVDPRLGLREVREVLRERKAAKSG